MLLRGRHENAHFRMGDVRMLSVGGAIGWHSEGKMGLEAVVSAAELLGQYARFGND